MSSFNRLTAAPSATVAPFAPPQRVGGFFAASCVNAGGRLVVPVGELQVRAGKPLTPVLPKAFDSQTYAGGPEKTPAPARNWLRSSPVISQLKPSRGDHSIFPVGTSSVRRLNSVTIAGLRGGLSWKVGTSDRSPTVRFI